jgi:hypothetical protein
MNNICTIKPLTNEHLLINRIFKPTIKNNKNGNFRRVLLLDITR